MYRADKIAEVLEMLACFAALIVGVMTATSGFHALDVALFSAIVLFAIYLALVRCARHLGHISRAASRPASSPSARPGSPPAAE